MDTTRAVRETSLAENILRLFPHQWTRPEQFPESA